MLLVLLTAGLSGCTDSTEIKTDDPEYVPPPVDDDVDFIDWLSVSLNDLSRYTDNKLDAINSQSWYLLEYYSESEEDVIDDTYKPECLSFDLSYKYDQIRDEYYEYLSDESWAAFHSKWAAKEMQSGDYSGATDSFNDSTEYTNKAVVHINTCTNLINDLI